MTATLTRSCRPHEPEFFDEFTSLLDQVDQPLGFEAGDANLYRYVGNSPTNFTDPTGKALVWNPPTTPRPGWLPGWVPWPYDDPANKMSVDPSDLVCPLMTAPKIGGSGLYKLYFKYFPSKKAAREAAERAGKCVPLHHPSPMVGPPHYHPTGPTGKKIPGQHYVYPK